MSDFNHFKEKHQQHLAVIRYAPETIKRYAYFLNRFFKYLEEMNVFEIAAVTKDIVSDYQTHIYEAVNSRGEPNSVFHQNNTLKAIKGFFRFLAEQELSGKRSIKRRILRADTQEAPALDPDRTGSKEGHPCAQYQDRDRLPGPGHHRGLLLHRDQEKRAYQPGAIRRGLS